MQGLVLQQQRQLQALQERGEKQRGTRAHLEAHLKSVFRDLTACKQALSDKAAEVSRLEDTRCALESRVERAARQGQAVSQELREQVAAAEALQVRCQLLHAQHTWRWTLLKRWTCCGAAQFRRLGCPAPCVGPAAARIRLVLASYRLCPCNGSVYTCVMRRGHEISTSRFQHASVWFC